MKLINKPITINELKSIASSLFKDVTKAVVDVEKEIMVVNAELHSDQESWLLKRGSKQSDLWGINLYPDLFGNEDFIEFDSMINLRPGQGNPTRGVENKNTREKIKKIVYKLIKPSN